MASILFIRFENVIIIAIQFIESMNLIARYKKLTLGGFLGDEVLGHRWWRRIEARKLREGAAFLARSEWADLLGCRNNR